jgi:hypothetical protein
MKPRSPSFDFTAFLTVQEGKPCGLRHVWRSDFDQLITQIAVTPINEVPSEDLFSFKRHSLISMRIGPRQMLGARTPLFPVTARPLVAPTLVQRGEDVVLALELPKFDNPIVLSVCLYAARYTP